MNEITQADLMALKYIWDKTGDLTRWGYWEEKRAALEKEYPHIIIAFNQMQFGKISVGHYLENAINIESEPV